MANHRTDMVTIKQIIRLYKSGKSQRSIERQLHICRPTIKKYIQAFQESGFSPEELLSLSESDLEDLFGRARKSITRKSVANISELEKLFPDMEKELRKVGVSKKLLWQEYKNKYPEGLGYSQFCYHFQQWQERQDVSMHIEHKAGDKVFIDFSGKKLCVIDKATGEEKPMEVFVAILPASQLTYVEAVRTQKKEDFIKVVENALWYFGGVPSAILSDNRTATVLNPLLN
ncbi:helix-turn-helix domain-containing protein [Chondrinema litorale]|uniref:helix-turn-helix domain-containing protein n=2 Tax=Chondrinema litorale TaxID=2994555 RepID=UPI0025439F19|nr:helix-turn-helix domain-containing protein [Chondrinema litorale]UZR99035.1 helix-turn-helix domain-containing protein [Chondrinema litorale]UZR99566.1 helix-turn-helix domain-containing protein [Chondrinema litorale]